MPVIDHDRERLDAVELLPFRRAIEDGIGAVMTTHVAFPTITEDAERPATLSRRVVTGLLREELGFDGLVLTDCMEMNAIADGVGTAEGCVQAVEAGCNQIFVSHTPREQHAAIDAVIDAVESGRISEERNAAAVRRVFHAKGAYDAGYVGDEKSGRPRPPTVKRSPGPSRSAARRSSRRRGLAPAFHGRPRLGLRVRRWRRDHRRGVPRQRRRVRLGTFGCGPDGGQYRSRGW
ncbi:glycoside hydrolase family 3 N-terminal domain-containing protein [Haladaptatus sp. R4]|uniref:glycoside hydrolase family 3 N-terminal domain-containing protein n=1 Tax=Haladaptatus sp. R4 TaxID=1679489 RepID=UPI002101A90B|nr:glycoside hydrolase family 3 N-terminal domain-containing protein [Haladaptatus sp. R4]